MIVRLLRPTPPHAALPTCGMLIIVPRFEVSLPVKMYCLGAALTVVATNSTTNPEQSDAEYRMNCMLDFPGCSRRRPSLRDRTGIGPAAADGQILRVDNARWREISPANRGKILVRETNRSRERAR